MPHNTEEVGINLLIEQLRRTGHEVKRLGGTFDLDVDGQLAEVKTKTKCFTEMDFISLTQRRSRSGRTIQPTSTRPTSTLTTMRKTTRL
jgi:hypothetical protein